MLQDSDVLAIGVDLHGVRGVDVGGVSGLASAAALAFERGAEMTLCDPPASVREALELEGLTGLIRTGRDDQCPFGMAAEIDLRQARTSRSSGRGQVVEAPDRGGAHDRL